MARCASASRSKPPARSMLACADIAEGVQLREGGVTVPILIFGALSVGDVDGIFDYDLTPTVSTPSAATTLEAAAARRSVRLSCHLKIDTGMNRLGFRHDQLDRTMPPIAASPALAIDGVYTHFATADVPDDPLFGEQRTRFEQARRDAGRPRHPAARHAHGQQRGDAARRARVVRLRAARPAALRPGAAAAGDDAGRSSR